jgi:hypothetical protein
MAIKKKGVNKKAILAVMLLALIVIGVVAAVVFSNQKHTSTLAKVGVHVGDTFTYSITGSCSGVVPNADYPGFYQLNDTQYYNVTVTGIQGDSVTLKIDWVFVNGTDIPQQQTIDLSIGSMTDTSGFSFLYPSNLKVNDPIYPHMSSKVPVNETLTQTYASGTRESAYFHVGTTQAYTQDPTKTTKRNLFDQIYFDRQTGILTSFSEIQEYNNPPLELEVIYSLRSSTVWNV